MKLSPLKLSLAKSSSPNLPGTTFARSWRYIVFALLAYTVFLCVMLPAERVYSLIKEKVAPLRLYQIEGSVWSGYAGMAVTGNRQIQNIHWTMHPWMLLLGRMEAAVEFDETGRLTQTVIGRTLGGTVYLADVKTRLPPIALENFLNIPGSGLDGEVDVDFSEVKFINGQLTALEGTLSWNNAGLFVTRTSPKTKLGSFVMTLSTKGIATGNEINGVLKDNPASPLRAEGILRVKPDSTYQFTGSLSLRDASRADLIQALRLFGSPGPGGKIPLSVAGIVPLLSLQTNPVSNSNSISTQPAPSISEKLAPITNDIPVPANPAPMTNDLPTPANPAPGPSVDPLPPKYNLSAL